MKQKKFLLIIFAFTLVVFIANYFQHVFFSNRPIINELFHTALVAYGAMTSLLLGLLLLLRQYVKNDYRLFWMAIGFVTMGLLDIAHSISVPNHQFILLHSASVFFGGLFFSFLWFQGNENRIAPGRNMIWCVGVVFVLVSILIFLFPKIASLAVYGTKCNHNLILINLLGGALCLVGSAFLFRTFCHTSEKEYYLYTIVALLLGLSGISYSQGEIWTASWWYWHVLRSFAFLIAFVLCINYYLFSILQLKCALAVLRLTEANLKKSEKSYRDLIESANSGIILVKNDIIVQVNQKVEALYGYSRDELIGQSPRLLTPAKYWKAHRAVVNEQMISNNSSKIVLEEEGIRKDGSLFPITMSISIEKQDDGINIIGVINDISDLKKSEEALRKSEEMHRLLTEHIPMHLSEIDLNGDFVLWNKYSEKLLGYTADEVIGIMSTDNIFESKEEAKLVTSIASEHGIYDKETNLVCKSKTLVPVHLVVVPKRNSEGVITGFYNFAEDITERKKIEEAVRRSEHKYQNLIQNANDGVICINENGIMVSFNNKAQELFGYRPEEVLGKHVSLLTPPEQREAEKKVLANFKDSQVLQTHGRVIEQEGLRKDGSKIPLEATFSSIKVENGYLITAILRDVSERKQAEKKLREAKEFLEKVIEGSKDGIIICDEKGHILSCNNAMLEMSGLTKEELIGQHPSMLVIDDRELRRDIFNKMVELIEKGSVSYETIHKNNNGDLIDVDCSSSVIRDEVGNIIAGISIIRNVTQKKKMEKQLSQSEKLKSLGELAGGVAHDFNNVLTAILGRIQLLRMRLKPPPGELQQGLDVIEKASLDGAETVRRIQEFARRRADETEFRQVDINVLIENVLDFTRPRWKDEAEAQGIKFVVNKQLSSLPTTTASESEIREVLTNLVNNALDAMTPQGGQLTIKSFVKNKHIHVIVEDSGVGMSKEVQEKIYNPFFTTKGPQSTGLGLSVSYGIIKRHKGELEVTSEEGKGTAFAIKLPVVNKKLKEVKIESTPVADRKAKILIIEDEEEVRKVIQDILTDAGHDVEIAYDGFQGISLFKSKDFTMVLTDLGMPGMSGWQVAEEIKRINNMTPVALITGWNMDLKKSEMKKNHVDFIIKKPFVVNQLMRLVQEGLEMRDRCHAA